LAVEVRVLDVQMGRNGRGSRPVSWAADELRLIAPLRAPMLPFGSAAAGIFDVTVGRVHRTRTLSPQSDALLIERILAPARAPSQIMAWLVWRRDLVN